MNLLRPSCVLASLTIFLLAGCRAKITALQPAAGRPADTIRIKGEDLTHGSNPQAVRFNGVAATNFQAVGGEIEVIVPTGATTGLVEVDVVKTSSTTLTGTAKSPYPFLVLGSCLQEIEDNDTWQQATDVGMADCFTGKLDGSEDVDWIKLPSGPSGNWGYTLEFERIATGFNGNFDLRVDMYVDDPNTVGAGSWSPETQSDGNGQHWISIEPGHDLYFEVSWTGSWPEAVSETFYEVRVSRFAISDFVEPDDDGDSTNGLQPGAVMNATPIPMSNNQGSFTGAFLCNILTPASNGVFEDTYKFTRTGGKNLLLTVHSPPVESPWTIELHLYRPNGTGVSQNQNQGGPGVSVLQYSFDDSQVDPDPDGEWFTQVKLSVQDQSTSGEGPAPDSCKAPYSIMVTII